MPSISSPKCVDAFASLINVGRKSETWKRSLRIPDGKNGA